MNRRWAAFLLVAGLINLAGNGLSQILDLRAAFALAIVVATADWIALSTFLAFVAAVPGAPAWMRSRWWLIPWIAVAVLVYASAFTRPAWLVIGLEQNGGITTPIPGPVRSALFPLFLAGIVAAGGGLIYAWRMAKGGSITRQRNGWMAAAIVPYLAIILGANIVALTTADGYTGPILVAFAASYLYLAAAAAYGILRGQMFDIDLRIKWTLSRSTVAAIFVAVFFAVSELSAAYLTDRTGSTLLGVGATTVLVFALAPLQRFADRVSDRAMPAVQDNEEYRTVRKREVYLAALESAAADGDVTEKEKDVLATLAQSLGLGPADVRAIEKGAA